MFVIDLDELERLLRVGTPGPWERNTNSSRDTRWVNAAEGDRDIVCDLDEADVSPAQQWDNAALIVALRNAVPELIARLREAEAERNKWMKGCIRADKVIERELARAEKAEVERDDEHELQLVVCLQRDDALVRAEKAEAEVEVRVAEILSRGERLDRVISRAEKAEAERDKVEFSRGEEVGVLEDDVAGLQTRAEKAEAEVKRLTEDKCPGGGYHKRAPCRFCD